jgi:hypothetical protein
MVEIVQLAAGEQMPEMPEEEPWLTVEASKDRRFFGSGGAYKPTGEAVFYASLAEDDVSLEAALRAATEWAVKYRVRRIWVQATPDQLTSAFHPFLPLGP